MEKYNYEGEKFLAKLYTDMHLRKEVEHSSLKSDKKNEKIRKYLEREERVHQKAIERGKLDLLKKAYYDKYVIKEVPEKYLDFLDKNQFDLTGHHLTKEEKEEHKRVIIEDQKKSLDNWIDYLTSEDARFYPWWAKYWAFQGMLKIGAYDNENGIYSKRDEMVEEIKKWENIKIEGTFSHFSIAFYGDGKESREQFIRFTQCIEVLKMNDIEPGMLHMCNSSAFLRFKDMHLNAVRIGSAILGRLSIPNVWGFKKVGYLKSNVAEIKILPEGYNIGYSNSYTTKKETKVAIVPCGYADGFNVKVDKDMFRPIDKIRYVVRDIKNIFKKEALYVKINGERCKILGRLGMYHVTVDITDKNIKINDEVEFEVSPMFVDSNIIRDYI